MGGGQAVLGMKENFELPGGLGVVKGGEVEAKTGGDGHSVELW